MCFISTSVKLTKKWTSLCNNFHEIDNQKHRYSKSLISLLRPMRTFSEHFRNPLLKFCRDSKSRDHLQNHIWFGYIELKTYIWYLVRWQLLHDFGVGVYYPKRSSGPSSNCSCFVEVALYKYSIKAAKLRSPNALKFKLYPDGMNKNRVFSTK